MPEYALGIEIISPRKSPIEINRSRTLLFRCYLCAFFILYSFVVECVLCVCVCVLNICWSPLNSFFNEDEWKNRTNSICHEFHILHTHKLRLKRRNLTLKWRTSGLCSMLIDMYMYRKWHAIF